MSDVTWGGFDPYEKEKPLRRLIREHLPGPDEGRVFTDLDLVVRHYGQVANSDGRGVFKLIELKHGGGRFGAGQKIGFNTIHDLLRKADPDEERYRGFYLVRYEDYEWGSKSKVVVSRYFDSHIRKGRKFSTTTKEFLKWLDTP